MRRYLRLLWIFLGNSLQLELEYRGNFVLNIFNSLIATAMGLLIIITMFGNADSLGGWTFLEVLTLYGVFMMMEALIDILLYPNLNRVPEYIRTGNMDFFLLKPISARFLVSFRYLRVWMVPQLLLGLGLVVYGMAQSGALTLGSLLLAGVMLASGAVLIYAIWFMLITTAFWLVKVENISELFNAFFQAGRFPVSAFPAWARLFLTVVVPIAFVTTVPASAAIGRLEPGMALLGVGLAVLLLVASQAFWRLAVANYTSASS
jgi:ABC-2 type transport system permease protein